MVALLVDVLRGVEPLLDRRGESPLQHDRFGLLAQFGQEREVRHVPGSDPDHIRILDDQRNVARVHDLDDERKPELVAGFGQELEPSFAESLKRIRGGPWLEGITAQDVRARLHHRFGGSEQLLARLDGTGTGDRSEVGAPERRRANVDDGVLILEVTADELERLQDRNRSFHTGKRLPRELLDLDAVADDSDDGSPAAF